MKSKLLDFLACPDCTGDIRLSPEPVLDDSGEIIEGTLKCLDCESEYPVTGGIPRFAELDEIEEEKKETAENFGWQWKQFTQVDEKYANQFLGWLQPVRPGFFEGRNILEGGCGKGRHTMLAAEWGAKEVIGIDLSEAVESAYAATKHLPNAHIVQADITGLPFRRVFDYAFSVGVLHHTPDPAASFRSLASAVREAGHLSAWVYGKENNEWITGIVDPVRKGFTSRISQPTLFQLSKLPTLAVYLASKLIYKPLNRVAPSIASKLFYYDYLVNLGSFGWREQHNIVFDHLVAPTAFYIAKDEFESWWESIDADDVEITWHNKNSWCGYGKIR